MASDKDKDKDKDREPTARAHADAVKEAHAPVPSPAPDHGPAGPDAVHVREIRPDDNPSGSEGIVVVTAGGGDVAGMPDPDYDPSVVPALSAYPDPNAPPVPGVTKDVSGNAREADAVPVHGWVDHDIVSTTGHLFPVHTPGLILIQHQVPADGGDQATDVTTTTTPAKAAKAPGTAKGTGTARTASAADVRAAAKPKK